MLVIKSERQRLQTRSTTMPAIHGKRDYRFSGGIDPIRAANSAWAAGSTGLCLIRMLAGSLPR
jgi:hypothetical protein